jgi:membrane-associated phospholipid phosphatase
MWPDAASTPAFWLVVSRLGEAQILLPAALLLSAWLALRVAARPLAQWWLVLLGGAAAITTATKLAFLGWGIGIAALDFTGISGHAMFAAAVYPLLTAALGSSDHPRMRGLSIALGYGLALLVGLSRVVVGAHSMSEALAGLLLGGLASAAALRLGHPPAARTPLLLSATLALWFMLTPVHAPPSNTHGLVTRLALALSGREHPYTRHDLLRARAAYSLPTQPGAPQRQVSRPSWWVSP